MPGLEPSMIAAIISSVVAVLMCVIAGIIMGVNANVDEEEELSENRERAPMIVGLIGVVIFFLGFMIGGGGYFMF